ncbi:MAG: hypothetical protein EHM36_02705, partial [Deltaproteobacteria bacterium]
MRTGSASVTDGLIGTWHTPPADGDYCLRVSAIDKIGAKSEAKVNVKVDTHPPGSPALSGTIENRSSAKLTWTASLEPDLSGYNLYRSAQRINTALIKDVIYNDHNLKEGVYTYTLRAIDFAGNESGPSNQVKITVDLTGPDARVRSPQDNARVSSLVDIKGTAYSSEDFSQYRVYTGSGANPSTWNLLRTSPVPISYGSLVQWDTIDLFEGNWVIKLEAEDLTGNVSTHQITVSVDNTAPAAPLLVSAAPSGSDVTLTWQANAESDLAGYLLYRNGQLANVSGIVTGDLKPYLIPGTTYLDKGLPDGKMEYHLVAMDQAGNVSHSSNTLDVTIDTRAPRATIVEPADRSKFQNQILVKAESPDIDIASVQLQYKRAEDTTWINLNSPMTHSPYVTYLDPLALGFVYVDYHLRAVATDRGEKTDSSPSIITVTYTDLGAPEAPRDLAAMTNGSDVTLTWTANTDQDLDGYNVYRTSGGPGTKVNASVVKGTTYQDAGLADGTYSYEIKAIDSYGNESNPSASVSAKIYAPLIGQPYTPVGQITIEIKGGNAAGNSSVEIFNETTSGPSSAGIVNADTNGDFTFPSLDFSLGENKITAKATDSAGNMSRSSEMVVVVYNEPPSAPTGLLASVVSYDVNLSWNPNSEPDIAGYNIFRDGVKLNQALSVTSGSATASSSSSTTNLPLKAFDSNPSTSWISSDGYGTFTPSWWELEFSPSELINRLEKHWASGLDYQGNEFLQAGKDFEIQFWSGYAWITQTKVTENNIKDNTFDFKPAYRTGKIRIYITSTTDSQSSKRVGISEVGILKENLIVETSFRDAGLGDAFYDYKVTAVDYYGFEGPPSNEVRLPVGDVTPPSPPQNLGASVSGSNVTLSWNANSETDLAGYNLYRNTSQGWLKMNASLIPSNA